MIVYLARDIPAFVMYCVNGESGSSLLIESTDSMININERERERERAMIYILENATTLRRAKAIST